MPFIKITLYLYDTIKYINFHIVFTNIQTIINAI